MFTDTDFIIILCILCIKRAKSQWPCKDAGGINCSTNLDIQGVDTDMTCIDSDLLYYPTRVQLKL